MPELAMSGPYARALSTMARELEGADLHKLLQLSFESAKAIPRIQKAERLARGAEVIDTEPVGRPGSSQDGSAIWNIHVYQPERTEPPPDLDTVNAKVPDEWEEAEA